MKLRLRKQPEFLLPVEFCRWYSLGGDFGQQINPVFLPLVRSRLMPVIRKKDEDLFSPNRKNRGSHFVQSGERRAMADG